MRRKGGAEKSPAHGSQSPTQKAEWDPIPGKSVGSWKRVKHIVVAELNTTEHRKAPANVKNHNELNTKWL